MNISFLKNPAFKKGLGIAFAIGSGIFAVAGELSDQRREREFEELKKDVSELKKDRN